MADRPATIPKKKPGRKRRVAGWLLLVIGVLITGVWGASAKWRVTYNKGPWMVGAGAGCGILSTWKSVYVRGFGCRAETNWHWYLDGELPLTSVHDAVLINNFRIGSEYMVVLWPFALASLLGGGWLVWSGLRARRRAMTGLCVTCGYDLAGLAAGGGARCPECGDVCVSPAA